MLNGDARGLTEEREEEGAGRRRGGEGGWRSWRAVVSRRGVRGWVVSDEGEGVIGCVGTKGEPRKGEEEEKEGEGRWRERSDFPSSSSLRPHRGRHACMSHRKENSHVRSPSLLTLSGGPLEVNRETCSRVIIIKPRLSLSRSGGLSLHLLSLSSDV